MIINSILDEGRYNLQELRESLNCSLLFLSFDTVGETQTKARTSRKSECLLRQGAKHNKSTIWTQSKECASKDNAKI